jgi:hypothetical protein
MTSRLRLRASSGAFLALLGFAGCVPQARYDDTKARLDQAAQGQDSERRKAAQLEVELAKATDALRVLQERTAQAENDVEAERANLAQARFETDVIAREREEAKQMSEQLLSELDRVAGHLRAFAEDKALLDGQREALAKELEQAQSRLAALALDEQANQQRFLAARGLTLELADSLENDSLRLSLVDGDIALQFPKGAAFASGAKLSGSAEKVIERAVSVLSPLAVSLEVHQPDGTEGEAAREQAVRDALAASGFEPARVLGEPEGVAGATTAAGEDVASAEAVAETPAAEAEDPSTTPKSDAAATDAESSDAPELELRLQFPSSES